jgi:hypothetical protein
MDISSLQVDVWVWLHARMVSSIHGFKKLVVAYKHNFNTLHKQYKTDKVANSILRNDCLDCKFYESMDIWWHFNGIIMKYVFVNANDSTTPTMHVESLDITTTYMENEVEMSNFDDIKPSNRNLKVKDISLHI